MVEFRLPGMETVETEDERRRRMEAPDGLVRNGEERNRFCGFIKPLAARFECGVGHFAVDPSRRFGCGVNEEEEKRASAEIKESS